MIQGPREPKMYLARIVTWSLVGAKENRNGANPFVSGVSAGAILTNIDICLPLCSGSRVDPALGEDTCSQRYRVCGCSTFGKNFKILSVLPCIGWYTYFMNGVIEFPDVLQRIDGLENIFKPLAVACVGCGLKWDVAEIVLPLLYVERQENGLWSSDPLLWTKDMCILCSALTIKYSGKVEEKEGKIMLARHFFFDRLQRKCELITSQVSIKYSYAASPKSESMRAITQ